jgi:hypothetical protein
MSAFWGHPLTVTVIGAGIIGVLVQQLTRWWQDQRKAWEIRISLVAEMSETAMGLMARFENALRLETPAYKSRASKKLDAACEEFAVNKAVVGTKLEAYLASPTSVEPGDKTSPSIADRWDRLAKVMTNLVELKEPDTDHGDKHRENLLAELTTAMKVLIQAERPGTANDGGSPEKVLQNVRNQLDELRLALVDKVDGRAWRSVLNAVLERKRVLVVEVRDAPMAFRTSWLPWGSGSVRTTRRNR